MMMSKLGLSLILILSLAPKVVLAEYWFDGNTPLTHAHQNLLNDDLKSMFTSLVEVWQQNKSSTMSSHLNGLLNQSLERDCGKSLAESNFPDWITSVIIRNQTIQSPGRDSYRAVVEVISPNIIKTINLERWVEKKISKDSDFYSQPRDSVTSQNRAYIQRYNLTNRLPAGLYRLNIESSDGQEWSSWVIFTNSKLKQRVRWASKDKWSVSKDSLLNPYCPLPILETALYDDVDGKYVQIWGQSYETDYPDSLDTENFPPNRYVLAVSMRHQRWQGNIVIEQSQTISKTYDISRSE